MAVLNNLYPPTIATYMPAFLVGEDGTPVEITDKQYTVYSYANVANFEEIINDILNPSDISSVEELYNAYQIALAEIIAEYPSPDDPTRIAEELALKQQYHEDLEELLAGYTEAQEAAIENAFDEIAVVTTNKTKSYTTVHTTNNKYICRVYFNISPYNTLSEIQNAQVVVRNQYTNKSVVNIDKYPCEVMLKAINTDTDRTTDDKYYIEIRPEDLENNNFQIDTYYKVQIRFTSANAASPNIDLADEDAIQAIDSWLAYEWANFSEWSTVCLIRGISEPTVSLTRFTTDPSVTVILQEAIASIQISGQLLFADENETETLKSYNIKLYSPSNVLLYKTEELYTDSFANVNVFNYDINRYLPAELSSYYSFVLTYTTNNLYIESITYYFKVMPTTDPAPDMLLEAIENTENSAYDIKVTKANNGHNFTGTLFLRRASSKDGFSMWEDVYENVYINASYIGFIWTDYTIESGVWYKYALQAADNTGRRTPMLMFGTPVMVVFEDMFLTTGKQQLKIKFNPSISSFKHTIAETKIETIGSQYPFFKRNGHMNYVQFPIGGLISTAMDVDNWLTSKEKEYGDMVNEYNKYNEINEIPFYQDVVWEKAFRNAVEKFLYTDDVKLFRSPTEGNFLVKIMEVNFQPNQTLGRRLWSFSAMAYEIDECTFKNYKKYNVYMDKVTSLESGD